MIPIVEDYLSDLIEGKLSYLKSNPNHIDRILLTNQVKLDRLKNFIKSKPIFVKRGYPITPAELPCICILLSGEEETQDGLGDYGEDIDLSLASITEEVEVISTRGAEYTFPYAKLSHTPVVEITDVVHNQIGTILEEYEYGVEDSDLGIMSCEMAEHGDTLTVTYTYKKSVTEQSEVMYESNYRIEVWAENGDLTVELYHILKWALQSGRDSLIEEYDLFRQRLSGADFEPAPNFFPSFVYRRALSFWCQYVVSTPLEDTGFIQGVQVNQQYLDGGDSNG